MGTEEKQDWLQQMMAQALGETATVEAWKSLTTAQQVERLEEAGKPVPPSLRMSAIIHERMEGRR